MNTKKRISLLLFGFFIWVVGTVVYRMVGSYLFEASVTEYWLNVIVTGILYSALCLGLMKWHNLEQKDWLQGAICLALPGMLGEIPILSSFSELMSNMQPETAGRYAAFLFGGYGALIGFAWLISVREIIEKT
ncbi:MAG: DUF5367 family protein [Xenococcaceae cyanobacterium MO_207.B15]|nr:DUF5367 family protein [Xenococcaceae cyanobacterium MO_207.B15]